MEATFHLWPVESESLAGFVAGVSVALIGIERLHVMGQPMERLATAAGSSNTTYQIYLYAPYSVAENFLSNHAFPANKPGRRDPGGVRKGFLPTGPGRQPVARLAKLAAAQGETEKATTLLDEAMSPSATPVRPGLRRNYDDSLTASMGVLWKRRHQGTLVHRREGGKPSLTGSIQRTATRASAARVR